MRYPRSRVYTVIRDEINSATYPEILDVSGLAVDVGRVDKIRPADSDTIVDVAKRRYGEADAYWLLMAINNIISPFERMDGREVLVPDPATLSTLYARALGR